MKMIFLTATGFQYLPVISGPEKGCLLGVTELRYRQVNHGPGITGSPRGGGTGFLPGPHYAGVNVLITISLGSSDINETCLEFGA